MIRKKWKGYYRDIDAKDMSDKDKVEAIGQLCELETIPDAEIITLIKEVLEE